MTHQTKAADSLGSSAALPTHSHQTDGSRPARFSTVERRAWRSRRKLRALRSSAVRGL